MNKANGDKGLRTNRGNEWARGVNKRVKSSLRDREGKVGG